MAKDTDAPELGWITTFVVLFSCIPVTLTSTAVSPVLPKILVAFADYPNVAMLTKQVMGVAGASMAVGCLVGSWLANRYNHRLILILGCCFYIVAGGLGFVLSNLYVLLVSRAVVGLSAAILATVALVALSQRSEGNRRDVLLGALVSLALISAVIAFPAAGFLGSINWRFVFLMYLLPVPMLVGCIFMPDVGAPRPIAAATQKVPFSLPYRAMLMGFMAGNISALPSVYVPFRFHDLGIDDPKLISLSLTIATVIGAIMSAFYGRMRRKLDIYQSQAISFSITACGLAIIATMPSIPVIMVGAFVFGCGLGPLAPNVFAMATRLPDHERARGIGLAKALMYGGPSIGILMLEPIDRAFGTGAALTTVAAVSFAMGAYSMIDRAVLLGRAKLADGQANQAA